MWRQFILWHSSILLFGFWFSRGQNVGYVGDYKAPELLVSLTGQSVDQLCELTWLRVLHNYKICSNAFLDRVAVVQKHLHKHVSCLQSTDINEKIRLVKKY